MISPRVITYYGFLSLFPLLLVLFTALSFLLHGHPTLQHDLRTSALADFPVIGDQISHNVTTIRGNGIAVAVGIAGTLWGGLGVANAAQNAMNSVWEVPMKLRPGFVPRATQPLDGRDDRHRDSLDHRSAPSAARAATSAPGCA